MENEAYTTEPANDDARVTDLLASLPRMSAPADFYVRVRARIAHGKPNAKVGFRLPAAVAYGIGLGVALVAFGLFGIVWMYSGKAEGVPAVAAVDHSNQTENPSNVAISKYPPSSDPENPIAYAPSPSPAVPDRSRVTGIHHDKDAAQKRGIRPDSAQTKARVIYPKGIDPNLNVAPPVNAAERGKPIQIKELLSFLGIGATFADRGWRVLSVTADSTAERIGLRTGDVIIAINDQTVNEDTTFAGRFSGKSLQFLRDGQNIHVDLAKK